MKQKVVRELIFKKGIVHLDGEVCGAIEDFNVEIKNFEEKISWKTKKNYSFSVTLKLPFFERLKHFFGLKTKFEKMFEKELKIDE